ncbi:developmental checkpoint coupling sporulation initiation to replication initiation [Lentibacillus persicus]|uniref:Developmental checkpoint coupling sporulation initiation to replication initiation n=1 Tax=Lentibacillus persicus TaxID=640948 RepID=A0A1I1UAE1_9BACI|nr:sporulation histidine kinase inhibitor Sda [Lentibacillus persicus]SFD67831.1 developmental checkpoint coupling sporulation initiation to replication initiation [Lentibacillus persicus]
MDRLSDKTLLEAYNKAKKLQLDEKFIELIKKELEKRAITFE